MNEQVPIVIEREINLFAASFRADDARVLGLLFGMFRCRAAFGAASAPRIVHDGFFDELRFELSAHGFGFGKFGHGKKATRKRTPKVAPQVLAGAMKLFDREKLLGTDFSAACMRGTFDGRLHRTFPYANLLMSNRPLSGAMEQSVCALQNATIDLPLTNEAIANAKRAFFAFCRDFWQLWAFSSFIVGRECHITIFLFRLATCRCIINCQRRPMPKIAKPIFIANSW